jgi:RNA polymerase sigma-70 factor (ECF subfamily)
VDRAVIVLHLDEKSYREIGEIIGTNPNNVACASTGSKTD